jgi:hypothetical protein
VATTLVEHLLDRARRHMEEAGDVYGDQSVEVLEGVVREGLADVNSRVVDERVDALLIVPQSRIPKLTAHRRPCSHPPAGADFWRGSSRRIQALGD